MIEKVILKPSIGIYCRTIFALTITFFLFIPFAYAIEDRNILRIVFLLILLACFLLINLSKLLSLISYTLKIEIHEHKFIFKESTGRPRSMSNRSVSINKIEDISSFWNIIDLFSTSPLAVLTTVQNCEVKGRTKQGRSILFVPEQPINAKRLEKKIGKYINQINK